MIICDLDVTRNDWRVYIQGPMRPQTAPADPTGGTTVDSQARATIATIIDKLQSAGVMV